MCLSLQLIIDPTHEAQPDEPAKEVDFFEEHEKLQLTDDNSLVCTLFRIETVFMFCYMQLIVYTKCVFYF